MLLAIAALALLPPLPHIPNPFAGVPDATAGVRDSFHAFRPGSGTEVRTVRSRLPGGWRLARTEDTFTSRRVCRLERRDVRLSSGVVTFSFGKDVDTANAVYRLDGGPVRAAGELGPEVAGLGSSYLSGDTWNPSDGRVRVPWTTLEGVRRIDIRANPHRNARAFPLDSLDDAVAAARQRGCSDLV